MKKALVGAALLLAPFFSLANIYENATGSVNAGTTSSCVILYTGGKTAAEIAQQGYSEWKAQKSWTAGDLHSQDQFVEDTASGGCRYFFNRTHKSMAKKSSGEIYDTGKYTSYTYQNTGVWEEAPSCPPQPTSSNDTNYYPDYTILRKMENGTNQCFSPQILADADTCEQKDSDGLYESFISSESGVSCMEKEEDGSICPVKKNFEITSNTTGNTSYFYEYDTSVSPSTCYQQNTVNPPQPQPLEIDQTFPSTVGQCSESNGISMCNENPLNVCDSNGNCQPGCGSISFGGQQEFVCLSGDIDNDSIPDYQDRDRDGDGILNEDDLDADGDGLEDAISNTPNRVRTPHQSSLEQLLAQIVQNTSNGTGGGSGSGASAAQIGESVADELEEKLVEQADFSGTEYEQSVNAKIEATDTAIDEFLENDEKDLTNAFDETDFQGSFSTLKTVLSPNGCSAQFSIPLTDSTLDLCEPASKAQPFLYVIFAISTFIYCMRRIQSTARSE